MEVLDNINKIKKLDVQGMLGSIESLGLQCQQAWDEVKKIKIPINYREVDNILINGMGGSGLGGHIIDSLYKKELKVPLKVINSYSLPGFVNQRTLYIISSYSGTTEEPVGTISAAKKRKAKILAICTGATLAKLAKQYKVPVYDFNPRFNPCNQPRMGVGYSVVGQIALLKKCGLLNIKDAEFKKAVRRIISLHGEFGSKIISPRNKAKKVARKLHGRVPVIIGAEHLAGNAHVMANQINENSKTFSTYFLISELNHHLMEGMMFPRSNVNNLHFLFIESSKYLPRIQRRFRITKKVLAKHKVPYTAYLVKATGGLSQVFEVLLFGSYVNFYMAMLNRIDPSPIPWVDYFKKELKRI